MDNNLDDCLPLDKSADSLPHYEDRVTHQALEAPTALPIVTSDLCEAPQPQDDASPKAPLHTQPVWDGEGVYVGDILPAVPFTLVNKISVDIPPSTLVRPQSLYRGEGSYSEPTREWTAVQSLLEEHRRLHDGDDGDYIEFDLDQFAVYIDAPLPGDKGYGKGRYPDEMRSLQRLGQFRCNPMYVDGILSVGDKKFSIRGVPFEELPIGNYGPSEPTVGSEIWIRSRLNVAIARSRDIDICYRLKRPATEYQRFHTGFLWVADLAKHVVDYLSAALDEKRQVVFRDFRSAFDAWLMQQHGNSEVFCRWRRQYPRSDFCSAIAANTEFIYKEASGVLGPSKVKSIYLWKEILNFTAYGGKTKTPAAPALTTPSASPSSPSTPSKQEASDIPKTVVTPYVDQLFNHLPCGMMIEALNPSPETERLRQDITIALRLESAPDIHTGTSAKDTNERSPKTSINVGDVISITRDQDEYSEWAREVAIGFDDVDRWFALVQKVHKCEDGKHSFDVIWMYRPVDTICGITRYPWSNELFISDHCNCDQLDDEKIDEEEVLAVHKVDWGGSSATGAEFFCRQTYLEEQRQFITFQKGHLCCMHNQAEEHKSPYEAGDTLLVCLKSSDSVVEPCELMELRNSKLALFRLLRRRQTINGTKEKIPPNELVYTNEFLEIEVKNVHSRCIIRVFQPGMPIPTPYDRKGVGNAFFIRYRWQSGQLLPLENGFTLRQGFDPAKPFRKLRGVDLFCGGGNFGRGLEEGGAIEMNWANDINMEAIHTYMANTNTENTVYPFAGSIDDMQRLALQGKFSTKVPPIGSVDFVSGGSPCPGFSRLTNDKDAPKQRKNQSLVAAFASFIDIYRPKFGLLENVMEIVQSKNKRNEDVFSQLICAIVGLGYQTHFFIMDSWTYGSPQSRRRVFLCFAAPGFKLPKIPAESHSHYNDKPRKGLGWLPNKKLMVELPKMPTPFKFVSIAEATTDLPDIMDGKADCCVSFPDHRMGYGITWAARAQLSVIPMHPYGENFMKTWQNGKGMMTAAERGLFPIKGKRVLPGSRAWGRVHPHSVLQTVTTTPSPTDARIGRLMHWSQNRALSVMEVRRAQGFLDHEVILGTPPQQWKVVGNSVVREVSLALGLSFREAWLGSLIDGEELQPTVGLTQQLAAAQAQAETAYGDFDSEPEDIAETDTLSTDSHTEVPVLASPRPQKRKLGSSFVIELAVSKMKKSRGQMAPERSERWEDDESAEVTLASASSSSISSYEVIELD